MRTLKAKNKIDFIDGKIMKHVIKGEHSAKANA